jgi:hypothetical protein
VPCLPEAECSLKKSGTSGSIPEKSEKWPETNGINITNPLKFHDKKSSFRGGNAFIWVLPFAIDFGPFGAISPGGIFKNTAFIDDKVSRMNKDSTPPQGTERPFDFLTQAY